MQIQHRSSAALGLFVAVAITASALTACGEDTAPAAPDTATSSVEATPELDPFEYDVNNWKKDTVTRIIDIGRERNESDTAVLAALTASYGEVTWWAALDGTSEDLFGWKSPAVVVPGAGRYRAQRNEAPYITGAINRFYQRGHDLNLTTDDPVDYAIAVQTTDIRPASLGDATVTYYQDRVTQRGEPNRFADENAVRTRYAEALSYAEAAFRQIR
ncbi:hypothetical protein [Rhodococcus sp. 14-2483-1-2]|uniref:hypothetical protein n=1 Tax=Rhodococcus sp. 14-2483-1-2 TaxID=2023147 RepID=UPI000B9B8F99|nr:hypothetical protein [Rhodococcus sp. 14-2483-1-2]OZF26227.1 hypothetical protein CH295_26870 [Rhodococcus sp. 14-2483-1-2]